MAEMIRLGILSDVHYAGPAERARGNDYEIARISNPLLRLAVRSYRRFFWLREPLAKNYLLDRFLRQSGGFDYVVANGDYSCDTANLGVSDDAAFESVRECLGKLRQKFGERFRANYGDHELGKVSLVGGRGGMRLASWHRARKELGLQPFWQVNLGDYLLLGVVSSVLALPLFQSDTLAAECPQWEQLRAEHLGEIRRVFGALKPNQRVLLFCHDPTALPFLAEMPEVQARLAQIEATIIGHLHSKLIWWKSRGLAGMPQINFVGHTVRRLSGALRQARRWSAFHVRLCPSLAGIELLKDGGYLEAVLDPTGTQPATFQFHPLPR